MRGHFLDLLEEGPRRALLDDVISDVNLLLAHYMRALFLLSQRRSRRTPFSSP